MPRPRYITWEDIGGGKEGKADDPVLLVGKELWEEEEEEEGGGGEEGEGRRGKGTDRRRLPCVTWSVVVLLVVPVVVIIVADVLKSQNFMLGTGHTMLITSPPRSIGLLENSDSAPVCDDEDEDDPFMDGCDVPIGYVRPAISRASWTFISLVVIPEIAFVASLSRLPPPPPRALARDCITSSFSL